MGQTKIFKSMWDANEGILSFPLVNIMVWLNMDNKHRLGNNLNYANRKRSHANSDEEKTLNFDLLKKY